MQTKLKRWPKVVRILQSFARAYFCIMIVVLLLQCFDAASNHRVPVSLNLAESTQQSMTGSINQSTQTQTASLSTKCTSVTTWYQNHRYQVLHCGQSDRQEFSLNRKPRSLVCSRLSSLVPSSQPWTPSLCLPSSTRSRSVHHRLTFLFLLTNLLPSTPLSSQAFHQNS